MAKRKKVETVERMQLIADAPSLEMVGAGLAALVKLGFENVGYKLITDVMTFKDRKRSAPPRPNETTNRDLIMQAVKGRKTFTTGELQGLFAQEGRSARSVSPILWEMKKAKMIKRTKVSGEYAVTAKLNGAAHG